MSYEEDRKSALLWEKVRVGSIVVALVIYAVSLATKLSCLDWARATAWLVAGYAAYREGRALKRLGRDPDSTYLRCALCVAAAVISVL